MTQRKTCKELEEASPSEWGSDESFYLYRNRASRMNIEIERIVHSSNTAGYGIDDSDVDFDTIALAEDIVENFMPKFSEYEMLIIIPAMQAELDKWQYETRQRLTTHIDKYGKS